MRGDEQELGGEVAVGRRRRWSWATRRSKPSSCGDRLRVQRQRRAGQRAGAERRHGGSPVPVAQPVDVPRAGPARARAAGGRSSTGCACWRCVQPGRRRCRRCASACSSSATCSVGTSAADAPGVVAQVQPQVGGDLVVAGPAGPQLAAQSARAARAARAPARCARPRRRWCRVRRRRRRRRPRASSSAASIARQLVVVEQAGAVQHPGVRPGAARSYGRQPPVEVDRPGQRGQRVGRAAGEPAAPQPSVGCVSRSSVDDPSAGVHRSRSRSRARSCWAGPTAR